MPFSERILAYRRLEADFKPFFAHYSFIYGDRSQYGGL